MSTPKVKNIKRQGLREVTGPTVMSTTSASSDFLYHGNDGTAQRSGSRTVPSSPMRKNVQVTEDDNDASEEPDAPIVPTFDMTHPNAIQGFTDNDFALFDALDAHQVVASPLDEQFFKDLAAPTMAAAVKKQAVTRPKKSASVITKSTPKASLLDDAAPRHTLPATVLETPAVQPHPANHSGAPPAPPEPDYLIAQMWDHLLNSDQKGSVSTGASPAQSAAAPPQAIAMHRAASAGSRVSAAGISPLDPAKTLADVVVPAEPVKLRNPPPVGPKPSYFELKTPPLHPAVDYDNEVAAAVVEAEPQIPEIDHDQPELEPFDPHAPANQTDDEDNPFVDKDSKSKKSSKRVTYDDGIDFSEIELKERIGIGGFAEVFKAEWRGTEVAVKKLLPNKQTKESIEEFKVEIDMMRKLRHPHIVLFMGASLKPPNVAIVTELLQMSLFDLLHNTKVKLTWKIRFKIAIDTAIGMNFLHLSKPPIIHRDLVSSFSSSQASFLKPFSSEKCKSPAR
jgi:hypothetical protein